MRRPPSPASDAMVSISVESDLVVVRPHGELDRAATETLVGVVGAATGCGSIAVVPLDDVPPLPSPIALDGVPARPSDAGVDVVGAGRIRVRSGSVHWTIDVGRHRFFRSDGPVDWRFVGPDDWIPITSLWAGPDRVAVMTDFGVVSLETGWPSPPRTAPSTAPDDRRVRGSAA